MSSDNGMTGYHIGPTGEWEADQTGVVDLNKIRADAAASATPADVQAAYDRMLQGIGTIEDRGIADKYFPGQFDHTVGWGGWEDVVGGLAIGGLLGAAGGQIFGGAGSGYSAGATMDAGIAQGAANVGFTPNYNLGGDGFGVDLVGSGNAALPSGGFSNAVQNPMELLTNNQPSIMGSGSNLYPTQAPNSLGSEYGQIGSGTSVAGTGLIPGPGGGILGATIPSVDSLASIASGGGAVGSFNTPVGGVSGSNLSVKDLTDSYKGISSLLGGMQQPSTGLLGGSSSGYSANIQPDYSLLSIQKPQYQNIFSAPQTQGIYSFKGY